MPLNITNYNSLWNNNVINVKLLYKVDDAIESIMVYSFNLDKWRIWLEFVDRLINCKKFNVQNNLNVLLEKTTTSNQRLRSVSKVLKSKEERGYISTIKYGI